MNTPAHLIIGVTAFGRAGRPGLTLMALAGSLLPDASLYFMVFWNRWVRNMSAEQIFGREYYSDFWQGIFAIDNSMPLWGAGLAMAMILGRHLIVAFFGAGLLHLMLDFGLHHDDGRAHFWPFSDWIFASPVSYWDSNHYGGVVGPAEALLCVALLVILWRRHVHLVPRALLVGAGLMEAVPAFLFPILFSGSV